MARDLSDARPVDAAAAGKSVLDTIFTPEFWTTVGGILANLLVVGVAIGYVNRDDADQLTASVGAIVAAVQTLGVNGLLIWKYIASRTQLRQAIVLQMMAQEHSREQLKLTLLMQSNNPPQQAEAMRMMGVEPVKDADVKQSAVTIDKAPAENTFNFDFEFKMPGCDNKDCPHKDINLMPVPAPIAKTQG